MAGKKIAVLRFEGPLQSWGERVIGDVRVTADFPTKSGVAGLIGCAMGVEREDMMLKDIYDSMTIAMRADRAGTKMTDLHTVTGKPLRTHDGRQRANGNTILTRREYIQDGSFAVFIEFASEEMLNKAIAALGKPVWAIYLGRECCVPSQRVAECVTEDFDSLMDAVRNYKVAERHDTVISYEVEEKVPGLPTYTRQDKVVAPNRKYGVRRVWRGVL